MLTLSPFSVVAIKLGLECLIARDKDAIGDAIRCASDYTTATGLRTRVYDRYQRLVWDSDLAELWS